MRQVVRVLVTSYWAQMSLPCAVHLDPAGDLCETFSLEGNVVFKEENNETYTRLQGRMDLSVSYTVAAGA